MGGWGRLSECSKWSSFDFDFDFDFDSAEKGGGGDLGVH